MMTQPSFCDDKALLVAFLYDECEDADRERMAAHLATCADCAGELAALRGTRVALGEWGQPEPALGFRVVREDVKRRRWAWPAIPVWAQAAAAVLVLAAGVGLANLHVTVGRSGVSFQTGWSQPAQVAAAPSADAALRAELAALRQKSEQLEQRIAGLASASPVAERAAAPAGGADQAMVTSLIAQSEARQKSEFDRQIAQRFVELQRDVSAQQRADFMRLQTGLVQFQGRTSADLAQLRLAQTQVQSYLVRVAQEIK